MTKNELKQLVKECIREVLMEAFATNDYKPTVVQQESIQRKQQPVAKAQNQQATKQHVQEERKYTQEEIARARKIAEQRHAATLAARSAELDRKVAGGSVQRPTQQAQRTTKPQQGLTIDAFKAIAEDTIRNTVPKTIAAESGMPTAGLEGAAAEIDPLELMGESASRWEMLANANVRPNPALVAALTQNDENE